MARKRNQNIERIGGVEADLQNLEARIEILRKVRKAVDDDVERICQKMTKCGVRIGDCPELADCTLFF
jgi:hypothetical protein